MVHINSYRQMLSDIFNKEITINGEKLFIGIARALSSDICQANLSEDV